LHISTITVQETAAAAGMKKETFFFFLLPVFEERENPVVAQIDQSFTFCDNANLSSFCSIRTALRPPCEEANEHAKKKITRPFSKIYSKHKKID
jgi:hypothetical protein